MVRGECREGNCNWFDKSRAVMFLHSGASLHGHEYSNRSPLPSSSSSSPPPFHAPVQRRNPLLRSALAASTPPSTRTRKRVSIGTTVPFSETALTGPRSPSLSPVSTSPSAAARSETRPLSDNITHARLSAIPSPDLVVRFKDPEYDYFDQPVTLSKLSQAMSEDEDEGSVVDVSDSDASRPASSAGRGPKRRRASRKSTTFLFAQPPPKPRYKERLIHIRPKLFLQMQQLSLDGRPRPVIDVYPTSAFAKTIVAPFLKRFPLISRIKAELSVQDIMLVRAEDYGAHSSELDSEGDDYNIKSRDLVAVLSPLRSEDKAEIVLADGTVWVASPRLNGSYDFISVDESGKTVTARWVRRQVVTTRPSSTSPSSPVSLSPGMYSTPSVDYKYTFSIIDPYSRRHPIMATLTTSSLDILDSYVTVSQSSNRYPPTSSHYNSTGEEDVQNERTSRPVEDWQRDFISVSAIWVALRHGWAPNGRPTSLISPAILCSASSKREPNPLRSPGNGANQDASPRLSAQEARARRRQTLPVSRSREPPTPGLLPKRATSTGAAFVEKRRAMIRANSDYSSGRESEGFRKASCKHALGGDWESRLRARQESELADSSKAGATTLSHPSPQEGSAATSTLAPTPSSATEPVRYPYVSPLRTGPEPISDPRFFRGPAGPAAPPDSPPDAAATANEQSTNAASSSSPSGEPDRGGSKGRHHGWRSVAGWFRKLGPSR